MTVFTRKLTSALDQAKPWEADSRFNADILLTCMGVTGFLWACTTRPVRAHPLPCSKETPYSGMLRGLPRERIHAVGSSLGHEPKAYPVTVPLMSGYSSFRHGLLPQRRYSEYIASTLEVTGTPANCSGLNCVIPGI